MAHLNNAIHKTGGTVKMEFHQSLRVSGHASNKQANSDGVYQPLRLHSIYLFPIQGSASDISSAKVSLASQGLWYSSRKCYNPF